MEFLSTHFKRQNDVLKVANIHYTAYLSILVVIVVVVVSIFIIIRIEVEYVC